MNKTDKIVAGVIIGVVSLIAGRTVLAGGVMAEMAPVAAVSAIAEPFVFVAVTSQVIVLPTSPAPNAAVADVTCVDPFVVDMHTKSGLLGYWDAHRGCAVSPLDRRSENMATIKIPYACKLLFQELQSMNIIPRLQLSEA